MEARDVMVRDKGRRWERTHDPTSSSIKTPSCPPDHKPPSPSPLMPPHAPSSSCPLPSSQGLHGGSILKGFLSRVSGADGFQLVNVTNAPIMLQGLAIENQLVNRVRASEGGALPGMEELGAS